MPFRSRCSSRHTLRAPPPAAARPRTCPLRCVLSRFIVLFAFAGACALHCIACVSVSAARTCAPVRFAVPSRSVPPPPLPLPPRSSVTTPSPVSCVTLHAAVSRCVMLCHALLPLRFNQISLRQRRRRRSVARAASHCSMHCSMPCRTAARFSALHCTSGQGTDCCSSELLPSRHVVAAVTVRPSPYACDRSARRPSDGAAALRIELLCRRGCLPDVLLFRTRRRAFPGVCWFLLLCRFRCVRFFV